MQNEELESLLRLGLPETANGVDPPTARKLVARMDRRRRRRRGAVVTAALCLGITSLWAAVDDGGKPEAGQVSIAKTTVSSDHGAPDPAPVQGSNLSSGSGDYQIVLSVADAMGRHQVWVTDGDSLYVPIGSIRPPSVQAVDPLAPPDDLSTTTLVHATGATESILF